MLVARMSLVYQNREFLKGQEITGIPDSVAEAWVESGAAVRREAGKRTKATRAGKKAGRAGIAYPTSGPDKDLVGQVPDPEDRGARPIPRKRGGRKDPG